MLRGHICCTLLSTGLALGQTPAPLHPVETFPLRSDGLALERPMQANEPFSVAGERGVLLGQQQGSFEAWVLPVKLLSHFTVEADVEGYPVPLDLNTMARTIEVRPDHTTITYSHIAVTVRQIMFAPDSSPEGTGAVVLFQVDAVRPVELVFRFTPELRPMWPVASGPPSVEWVQLGSGGFYALHTDVPGLAAAVAMPRGQPGIVAPYQERPQFHPTEFHLHVDPRKDRGLYFPLLLAAAQTRVEATNATLAQRLAQLNDALPELYRQEVTSYRAQESELTSIETPDPALNADIGWAEASVRQLRARAPSGEVGLVAGYYASGDSARPGFGWYFGRDTLYTVYALDSYGDFATARSALEFLLARQRADGKMMHEYSQTAASVDWGSLPYEYAAADSTPLFLMALADYVRSSGDLGFLRQHKDAVLRAWSFETTHDSNGDGVYDNAEGTGWVESWPPGMPKQEIYLALLDEQASTAMASLAALLQDATLTQAAEQRSTRLHDTIEAAYYQSSNGRYAFSRNAGGVVDTTDTVFPSVAAWDGTAALVHPQASLSAWSSPRFDTDWGARDVAEDQALYDPISYHQGSVWPLFTGWAAMAEYRGGRPLAGYQLAMQNAGLTYAQDPGAVTELLSGDFYEPFGRSTSHQLWSSAMVATPVLRGLFGLRVDGTRHTVDLHPNLPANWEHAALYTLHVGDSVVDLDLERRSTQLVASLKQRSGPAVRFEGGTSTQAFVLPAVQVFVRQELPQRGSRTLQLKVVDESYAARSLTVQLQAPAGSVGTLQVVRNDAGARVQAEGATIAGDTLSVAFPQGSGYRQQSVTLRW